MRIKNRNAWLLLLTLSVACVTATAALRVGSITSAGQQSREDVSQLPIADLTAPRPTDPREIAKRRAKSKKYSRTHNDIGPGVRAVFHYHWPPGFPPLPVSESDAVVVGVVSKAAAYLTEDETGIYSEFSIRIDEVLKADARAPLSAGGSVIADRLGGRVRYATGETGQFSIEGRGMPREGKKYVLFLKRGGQDEDYQILTGYELRQGRVFPLDRGNPTTTDFDIYANADEGSFLKNLWVAVNKSL